MLLASQSLLRHSSLTSLFLCLEKTDPTRPLVFQVIHRLPSERNGPHPSHPVVRCNICGCAWRASCLQRERVEAGKALRRKRGSGRSDLAKGSTGQSKDMGPTCEYVTALNGNVVKHVRSRSFADWVSCTNIEELYRSHRAEKRRRMLNHAKQHRESKKNTKCTTHRNGKPRKKAPRPARRRKSGEARGRPSHIGLVGLRENTLQHNRRNTRDTQLR